MCLAWLHRRPLLPLTGCGGWSDQLERNPPDERQNSRIISWGSIEALERGLSELGLASATRHEMANVTFIGLGRMGLGMAQRLLAAGHRLRVYNRTTSRAASLVEQGAVLCPSPTAAAQGAEVDHRDGRGRRSVSRGVARHGRRVDWIARRWRA